MFLFKKKKKESYSLIKRLISVGIPSIMFSDTYLSLSAAKTSTLVDVRLHGQMLTGLHCSSCERLPGVQLLLNTALTLKSFVPVSHLHLNTTFTL